MASNTIGGWAFIIGIILAIILGAFGGIDNTMIAIILIVIGLIVGFLNVTGKEVQPFMMAGVVLVIVTYFGGSVIPAAMGWLSGIFKGILILFVPATIIVALKSVFSLARK